MVCTIYEKINTYVQSERHVCLWKCLDPLKMYLGKNCVEKFVEYNEDDLRRLCSAFPQ